MAGMFVGTLRVCATGMTLLALNKPFGTICQFSPHPTRPTLAECIAQPGVYPAGRLDADSEGLLLLTDDGRLQARIAEPERKLPKTYWAQVEATISSDTTFKRSPSGSFTMNPFPSMR